MKTTISFIIILLYSTFSNAQINPQTPWTWMKGDNTIDQFGVYGTQGIPQSDNKPGARSISSTWRDQSGNLWLFGGMGLGSNTSGFLNDLWKFNPLTNKWAWMKGDDTTNQYSVYGNKGITGPSNKPGGTYSGISWVDNAGNFWLFGGYGHAENEIGLLNALWKYDPATNEWTWINGDKTIGEPAIYGNRGISHASNKPGARYCSQSWTDQEGNLWLFGGYGYDQTNSNGELNDIWKYNIPANEWTWIKGDSSVHQTGTYGTKGIPNGQNTPGGRYLSSSWKDQTGNIWLFGGYGFDENNLGSLNDLWKYNPLNNEWVWISGDKITDQVGVYGVPGIPAATNKPGSRYISSSWSDISGDLWIFGGYGYDTANSGYLNDLWKYSPVNNKWTWVKGDNSIDQLAIYGTQGMPDSSNKSGARNGSVSWSDDNGNLWLFGGYGFDGTTPGVLNDLWKITGFELPLPLHLLQFSGSLTNETVRLQWEAEMETGFSHFNIQRSFDGINFVTIRQINGTGNSNLHAYSYHDMDLRNNSAQKVFYRLQMMDTDGKFTYSKIVRFDWQKNPARITIFPNPAITAVSISFTQAKAGTVLMAIIDMNGAKLRQQAWRVSAGRTSTVIDVRTLPSGVFILSFMQEDGTTTQQKFIRQ